MKGQSDSTNLFALLFGPFTYWIGKPFCVAFGYRMFHVQCHTMLFPYATQQRLFYTHNFPKDYYYVQFLLGLMVDNDNLHRNLFKVLLFGTNKVLNVSSRHIGFRGTVIPFVSATLDWMTCDQSTEQDFENRRV